MGEYMKTKEVRREFLMKTAAFTGGVVLAPLWTSCRSTGSVPNPHTPVERPQARGDSEASSSAASASRVPTAKPADWNPIVFNRIRGNAGAIPKSYLPDINGPDGVRKHLGKHLPYIPKLQVEVAHGMIALMWGDPTKGYARHPNAVRSPANRGEGHWYNWIRISKTSTNEEVVSQFAEWPSTSAQRENHYIAFGGDDITADEGRNTVYLAQLPTNVSRGDTLRIWAHCLTHGEYIDFLVY